jgi:hypothetical protein
MLLIKRKNNKKETVYSLITSSKIMNNKLRRQKVKKRRKKRKKIKFKYKNKQDQQKLKEEKESLKQHPNKIVNLQIINRME